MTNGPAVGRSRNGNRFHPIPEIIDACHRYFCKVRCAALSVAILRTCFKEHREGGSDLLLVERKPLCVSEVEEQCAALLDLRRRCRPLHAKSGGSGSWRIGKHVEIGKGKVCCDGQCIPERRVSFARESHHEIGPKSQVRNFGDSSLNQVEIGAYRMASIHSHEDVIVSALKRNMKIGAEF